MMLSSIYPLHLLFLFWYSIILETRQTKTPFSWDLNKPSTDVVESEEDSRVSQSRTLPEPQQSHAQGKASLPYYGRSRKYKKTSALVSALDEKGDCIVHRPECLHWPDMQIEERKIHKRKWYSFTLDNEERKRMYREKYYRSKKETKEKAKMSARERLLAQKANKTEEELKQDSKRETARRGLWAERRKKGEPIRRYNKKASFWQSRTAFKAKNNDSKESNF